MPPPILSQTAGSGELDMTDKQETQQQFSIEWRDAGREPQCPSNPKYPKGIDLDCSEGAPQNCVVQLPYPAKRCGAYVAQCRICGYRVAATTAGRADDPRTIKVACKNIRSA